MHATAIALLAIFEKKVRLEVPLFQRQYVWGRGTQWEPLWEDIQRKFVEYLDGRKDAPVHFLGAMVLDEKFTPTTHVERRQVIDGQQRLTTLQIFLAAFRDLCRELGCSELSDECETFTLNKGMMADPTHDRFKVWPSTSDRPQFMAVLLAGSAAELQKAHPLIKKKYAKRYESRPRMVEAYFFFDGALRSFFLGEQGEPPLHSSRALSERLEECFQALKSALQVVAIDLEQGDDAQVIFETLNARGEPLLPADLLRNYIFLRAVRLNEDSEALYNTYWKGFDEPFWREEIRQGRLSRPRSDLFMQHFLASQQGVEIPVKHLFVEYKFWIERTKPFGRVSEELQALAQQGNDYRHLIVPTPKHPSGQLAEFLGAFDMSTAYPFLLAFMRRSPSPEDWATLTQIVESYVLRRAVCGLTNKNYNRLFLQFAKVIQRSEAGLGDFRNSLLEYKGDSTEWPSDERFREAWLMGHAYGMLGPQKVSYLLRRLNAALGNAKYEDITINTPLTVEHILPQSWIDHWPLPDGTKGMTGTELFTTAEGDERARDTRMRNALLQTIGNLTLLTQPLNSSVSNREWAFKRSEINKSTLLPITRDFLDKESWNEGAVVERGQRLLKAAMELWPRG